MLDRKPPFGTWRINPWHPLANGLRFYIVCGNGFAVDLVTGRIATFSGTYGDGTMFPDGQAADIDGSDYFDFADEPSHSITGDCSVVWRGVLDDTGDAALCCKASSDAGFNSPFYFVVNSSGQLDFIRTNATEFSFWRSGLSVTASQTKTYGVANPAVSNTSCKFYDDGVLVGGESLLFSAGASSVTATTQPLRIGRDIAGTPKQLDGRTSVVIGWARMLVGSEFLDISRDPYGLIDIRRNVGDFTGTSPPPPPPSNTNYLMPMLGVGDD